MKILLRLFLLMAVVASFACTPDQSGTNPVQEFKITGVSLPTSVTAATGEEIIFKVYADRKSVV